MSKTAVLPVVVLAEALDRLGARIYRDLHLESSYLDPSGVPGLEKTLSDFSMFTDECLTALDDPGVIEALKTAGRPEGASIATGRDQVLEQVRAARWRIVLPADDYNEVFVLADEEGREVPPHFECETCGWVVDDAPCPSHAPLTDLPGLRLIDCDASPRHFTWAHQREDYGLPCPWCLRDDQAARDAEARHCRHHWWRRSAALRWFSRVGYSLGILSGSCHSTCDGCNWCVTLSWRGKRPYVLGVSRDTWRCWSSGHRRGEDVGLGFCGKCVPWPCCGSTLAEHDPACLDELVTAAGEAGYVLTDAGRQALTGAALTTLAEIVSAIGQGVSWEQIATDEWDGEPCFAKAPAVDADGEVRG